MSLPSGSPTIEPSLDIKQFVQQATGTHPRAGEIAEKLRAWLEANHLSQGVHIRIIKGKKPESPGMGYDWMSTANDTVLKLNLDYHENLFWLMNRNEKALKRFLKKEGLDLLKLDCTRWYVSEKPKAVAEAITPTDLAGTAMKPTLVPYKSPVTGDEGMALHIPWPEKITSDQWNKISQLMKQKGYDIRDGADAQRFVYGYMQKFNNKVPPVLQDWIDTIALVLDVKAPSQSPDVKTAGATPANKVFRRAVKEWGTTHDPALAGYILPSGAMLDMSGSRHGSGGGVRAYDHREVEQFMDEHFGERIDAMHAFMDMGAIRWMPEGNSLDIRKPPTPQQLTTLRRVLDHAHGNMVVIDVYWPSYGSAVAEYPGRVKPDRIVRDIQNFYKTGELKPMSQVQQFHQAVEEVVESLLSSNTARFNPSYAARGVAAILLEAEQLELPLDNEGDEGDEGDEDASPLSSEEIGDWLGRIGITKGYKQIDGDYGDPWLYGGTWYSAGVEGDPDKWASIVHFDGVEALGIEDYWSGSKKVKEEAMKPEWRAKIAQVKSTEYPDDEDDERATDVVLDEIADRMNAERKFTVYRTNAEDPNEESWVTDHLSELLESMGLTHEQWMDMGPEGRVCVVGTHHGWHELDQYPHEYTKEELSKFLGIEL